jgi:hypothetical protein
MVNENAEIIHVSCKTQNGLDHWARRLRALVTGKLYETVT